MTLAHFDHQMSRLRVLRAAPAGDTAMDAYFDALSDVPVEILASAVDHALKTRAFFPMPAELRADADHVARSTPVEPDLRVRETPLHKPYTVTLPTGKAVKITKEWDYDCNACSDGGMLSYWCGERGPQTAPWSEFRHCGRRHEHGSHEWVGPCPCVHTNPTIQRRKAAGVRYAQPAEKVSA